jgi:PAS domain S-box-containing protein
MARPASAKSKVIQQMAEMQRRLAEAEDTLDAIRSGAVDALVVHTPRGEQLFTLKGADQTYRALVEAMNEGAVTLKNGIISYCNNHFAEMIRKPMEKVFGTSIFELVQSEKFSRLMRRLQTGKETHGSVEADLRTDHNIRMPVLISASRFYSESQATIGLVVTDITERIEAERARQDLSRSILSAQEQERQRVARDLHDSVNQLLSSAQYRLNSSRYSNGPTNGSLRPVRELIERAIAEVRLISRNLRPGELDDLGLVAALRSLTHEFRKRTRIAATLKSSMAACPAPVPKEVELTIYRIAQEALANVEKHSRATSVRIELNCLRTQVLLLICDNGKGFARRPASGTKSGWGLENMNERATLLGGTFEVTSLPRKGTRIVVRLPLKNSGSTVRNRNR